MSKNLLEHSAHRPYALPNKPWRYYQEWNKALFLHWKISEEELKTLIPQGLQLDIFEGSAWVSLVAFTMEKIRPKELPALSFVSDFHEINLRTYVNAENKPGVYFINMEGEKYISVYVAKALSGMPYEKASISRSFQNNKHYYTSFNKRKKFELKASFAVKEQITKKSELDKWLTERYCAYLDKNKKIWRYEIHHKEWNLNAVELLELKTNYTIGNLSLDRLPDLSHYSEGVKVLAWGKEILE